MLNFVDELGPISAESHRIDFVHKRILCGVFLCDESSRVSGSGYAHPGTGPLDTRIALDGPEWRHVFASGKETVIKRVLNNVKPGAIILMHEGDSVEKMIRIEALRAILLGLYQQGFSCIFPRQESLHYS